MVSIGIAALDATKPKAPGALVDLADQALYRPRKQAGTG
jgi:GGDEF domain-containing protein